MPYVINNTSGSKIFYIQDTQFNTETALTLPGRNVPDYGEPVDTNFVHLLENFADSTPPQSSTTLTGQLWYDTSDSIMKVYNGASWVAVTNIAISEGAPGGSVSEGNMYFDETIRKLKIYYDSMWIDTSYAGEISSAYNTIAQGSPLLYGTRVRNIFLTRESDDRDVPVLAITQSYDGLNSIGITNGTLSTLYGSETLICVLSRNETFVVKDATTNSEEENLNWYGELTQPGGIGTLIQPGLNMRKDATAEYPIASLAQRAQTSYNLNLGSYGADGANIAAANVFRHDADNLPAANIAYDLGSPTNVFAEAWVNDVYLSNALLGNGSNISIGTDQYPIENVYVTNIEIDGSLVIEGEVTIGSDTSPVAGIYVDELYVESKLSIGNTDNDTNFVFPDSRAGNSRLVCDDDGQLYWLDNFDLFTNISSGNGIAVNTTQDFYGANTNIVNREASITARLGNGLKFDTNTAIELNFQDFTTDDIQQGVINLYYSDTLGFQLLSDAVNPSIETGLTATELPSGDFKLELNGGASSVVGTIFATSESAITVSQNRNNIDNNGFNSVELDVALGPDGGGDGVTGIPSGSGLVKSSQGEIGLDWLAVADNLYTNDLSQLPTGTTNTGRIGIKRVSSEPTAPTTHVLYIESIDNIGGGTPDKLMFLNKTNVMAQNSGQIQFGTGDSALTLGITEASGTVVNSRGYFRHLGSMFLRSAGSSNDGSLVCDGDITSFRQNTASDLRLKKNIATIDNGLQKVNAMRGVSYQLRKDDSDNVGVIAQEMEEIVPEVVKTDQDGMKSVNYGALVGVLIEAVKELTQEVETLKAKLGD
jgi:hypothetical protein